MNNQRKKNLIFIISYLDSLRNWVDPIYPFLREMHYKITILHMQSLSFGIAKSDNIINPEYKLYDIGKKKAEEITNIIKSINPASMIFLNFKSLFELLLMRMAKVFGIRTIYIQHGLLTTQTFKFKMANKKSSFFRYIYLVRLLLQFLFKIQKLSLNEIIAFFQAMLWKNYKNIKFDYKIYYSEQSFKMFKKYFEYSTDRAYFSGYPIVKLEKELESYKENLKISNKKKILYIHQIFIRSGLTNISYKQEVDYLRSISNICHQLNYQFVFRLHPRESIEKYKTILKDGAVKLEQSSNLLKLVQNCDLVIGQYSTALFYPVLFYKPILILYYPGLKFSDSIFNKIGLKANSDTELYEILNNPKLWFQHLSKYKRFRDQYIGNNNSYEHLAKTIKNIIYAT